MPASVTLEFTAGPMKGQQLTLAERTTCLIGRDRDCTIRIPAGDKRNISRHHCLLDVNPPDLRIRDLGSRNGTYINGTIIGRRPKALSPSEVDGQSFPQHDLKSGDEVRIGETAFRVSIHVPPSCGGCQAEIPEDARAASEVPTRGYLCQTCRYNTRGWEGVAAAIIHACSRCGKDITAELGGRAPGEYLCRSCKGDPLEVIRDLVERAGTGDQELVAVEGYEVEKLLGEGGMGAVYLARRQQSGQEVALKVMLPQVALNGRSKQLFLREVEVTRALRHRHIVRLFDMGCSRGIFFFTMEYCDAGSLAELMKARGGGRPVPLPVDQALRVTYQVLSGLEYAHTIPLSDVSLPGGAHGSACGITHRDLKPQNIFLVRQSGGLVKLGDFGLAKAFDLAGLSGLSVTGTVAGTPGFMPRQQVINFRYCDPDVDVWAAAATLYYMLTAQTPREFPRGCDRWQVVLQSKPVPIRDRNPAVPQRLARVIDAALRDRPDIGIRSAAELKEELQRAL